MLAGLKNLFSGKLSNQTAKNRLQMVLVQDRSGLSSDQMESFRTDLLDVITKYFSLEKDRLDIEWQRVEGCTALVINTPVISKHAEQKSVANA